MNVHPIWLVCNVSALVLAGVVETLFVMSVIIRLTAVALVATKEIQSVVVWVRVYLLVTFGVYEKVEAKLFHGNIVARDPCNPSPCGEGARCELSNGSPICSCPRKTTGNPFIRCSK